MFFPAQKRVLQCDVTNRCSLLRCSNCTRSLILQDKRWDMTPANFEQAVACSAGFVKQHPRRSGTRIFAMIGGNPCASEYFEDYCKILGRSDIPKESRGLWTENLMGKGALAREYLGFFNLNVHSNEEAADEMRRELPDWPYVYGSAPFNRNSVHAPQYTAIQDYIGKHPELPDEAAMWRMIEGCDVNREWSGSIYPFDLADGSQVIRGYFCEIIGTFEVLKMQKDRREGRFYGPTHGVEITPGWWRKGMDDEGFSAQHKTWCRTCGHALKLRGHRDLDFTDDFTDTHRDLVQIAIKRKQNVKVHDPALLADETRTTKSTDYQRLVTV